MTPPAPPGRGPEPRTLPRRLRSRSVVWAWPSETLVLLNEAADRLEALECALAAALAALDDVPVDLDGQVEALALAPVVAALRKVAP